MNSEARKPKTILGFIPDSFFRVLFFLFCSDAFDPALSSHRRPVLARERTDEPWTLSGASSSSRRAPSHDIVATGRWSAPVQALLYTDSERRSLVWRRETLRGRRHVTEEPAGQDREMRRPGVVTPRAPQAQARSSNRPSRPLPCPFSSPSSFHRSVQDGT